MQDDTLNLRIKIPKDIHRRYKAAVAANGKTLQAVTEHLLIEYIKKNEHQIYEGAIYND